MNAVMHAHYFPRWIVVMVKPASVIRSLMVASLKMDVPMMRVLTAAGASPTTRDNKGLSALDHIHSGSNPLSGKVNQSRVSAIAVLVEAVAIAQDDPDIEVFGLTPMHWAALSNDDEMLNRLLQMGADPFKPAKNGKTVFECAVNNKKAWHTMLSELAIQFRNELDQMRVNDPEQGKPTHYTYEYFNQVETAIETAFKVNIPETITVGKYCVWLNNYKAHVKYLESQKNDIR